MSLEDRIRKIIPIVEQNQLSEQQQAAEQKRLEQQWQEESAKKAAIEMQNKREGKRMAQENPSYQQIARIAYDAELTDALDHLWKMWSGGKPTIDRYPDRKRDKQPTYKNVIIQDKIVQYSEHARWPVGSPEQIAEHLLSSPLKISLYMKSPHDQDYLSIRIDISAGNSAPNISGVLGDRAVIFASSEELLDTLVVDIVAKNKNKYRVWTQIKEREDPGPG